MQLCSIDPMVTFIISTHNRRDVLLNTLQQLAVLDQWDGLVTQTIVVDNASRDGTAAAVAAAFPDVQLIGHHRNAGACAKNAALPSASGEFVVFLDDDSYPIAGSIPRMIDHFLADTQLGAAVFKVTLPDGTGESSAYPSVVIGCGTGFRRSALQQVGGLPTDFFMQAEEYDLSLRLLHAGWRIRRFTDLQVNHLKTSSARIPTRTTRLDVRNNLLVVTRRFPRNWVLPFAISWTKRYWWLAKARGISHQLAFAMGLMQGIMLAMNPSRRQPVGLAAFETFAMIVGIRRKMDKAKQLHGLNSIVLIDLGKNILPFILAAEGCGLRIAAIADNRLAKPGRKYRGVPVVSDADAATMIFDTAILAKISPAHVHDRITSWQKTGRPMINLFETSSGLAAAA